MSVLLRAAGTAASPLRAAAARVAAKNRYHPHNPPSLYRMTKKDFERAVNECKCGLLFRAVTDNAYYLLRYSRRDQAKVAAVTVNKGLPFTTGNNLLVPIYPETAAKAYQFAQACMAQRKFSGVDILGYPSHDSPLHEFQDQINCIRGPGVMDHLIPSHTDDKLTSDNGGIY